MGVCVRVCVCVCGSHMCMHLVISNSLQPHGLAWMCVCVCVLSHIQFFATPWTSMDVCVCA